MKITVFTPTYNRAYLLPRLYYSLQQQNYDDFEWLLVDDGSTDATEVLVNSWQKHETKFQIIYYKQKNGGKHRAINMGLKLAQGEWFFIVDSDDYLVPDALGRLSQILREISIDNRICSVCVNWGDATRKTKNRLFPERYIESDMLERYKRADGERIVCVRTDVHRQYRYPEFQGEKFITEAVCYNRWARDGYKARFYNDVLVLGDYQEDGLTLKGNELFIRNPYGYALWLREKNDILGENSLTKFRCLANYTCELSERLSCRQIAEAMKTSIFLVWVCWLRCKLLDVWGKLIFTRV